MSSWEVGVRFSKLPFLHDFFLIMPKVRCFKNIYDNGPFLNIFSNLSKILIFSEISFKGISFVKLTLSSYFIAKFWDFKTHAKSKVFQKYIRQRAFFSKFDVNLRSWGNYCGRSFDQAATLSLRGPAQFTLEARSAEFTGGIDGMGRGIKSVLYFFLF